MRQCLCAFSCNQMQLQCIDRSIGCCAMCYMCSACTSRQPSQNLNRVCATSNHSHSVPAIPRRLSQFVHTDHIKEEQSSRPACPAARKHHNLSGLQCPANSASNCCPSNSKQSLASGVDLPSEDQQPNLPCQKSCSIDVLQCILNDRSPFALSDCLNIIWCFLNRANLDRSVVPGPTSCCQWH